MMDEQNWNGPSMDLSRQLRELKETRGPCPRPDRLLAFQQGEISDSEAPIIRAHLEECGLCELELYKLNHFRDATRKLVSPHRAWGFAPAGLGYALALMLAVPAVLYVKGRLTTSAPSSLIPADLVDLNVTRSPELRTRSSPSSEERIFTFQIPVQPDFSYTFSFQSGTSPRSEPVAIRPADEFGNFYLILRTGDSLAANTRLWIEERNASGVTTRTFTFNVTP